MGETVGELGVNMNLTRITVWVHMEAGRPDTRLKWPRSNHVSLE